MFGGSWRANLHEFERRSRLLPFLLSMQFFAVSPPRIHAQADKDERFRQLRATHSQLPITELSKLLNFVNRFSQMPIGRRFCQWDRVLSWKFDGAMGGRSVVCTCHAFTSSVGTSARLKAVRPVAGVVDQRRARPRIAELHLVFFFVSHVFVSTTQGSAHCVFSGSLEPTYVPEAALIPMTVSSSLKGCRNERFPSFFFLL